MTMFSFEQVNSQINDDSDFSYSDRILGSLYTCKCQSNNISLLGLKITIRYNLTIILSVIWTNTIETSEFVFMSFSMGNLTCNVHFLLCQFLYVFCYTQFVLSIICVTFYSFTLSFLYRHRTRYCTILLFSIRIEMIRGPGWLN